MKKTFVKLVCIFLTMFVFVSCLTLDPMGETEQERRAVDIKLASTKSAVQDPNLYKGRDITIAVLKPTLSGVPNDIVWISQFLQDSITGKFARYTKMRVVDRSNEELVKAEIRKSESLYYTEEECIEVGQMLNAKHVTFGTVQKINDSYNMTFRINDIEKNVICASAEGRYSRSDLESGYAANDVTLQLLEGLGIELTGSERNKLTEINSSDNRSVKNLAKGSVAGTSGNIIEALDFYNEVGGSYKAEADRNIQLLLDGTIPTDNIKDRAAFFQKEKEKWKKTFKDLDSYLSKKLPIIVYDFSSVNDKLHSDLATVDITIGPGVKVFPNRTALIVWKEVLDAWEQIRSNEEYGPLVKSFYPGNHFYEYTCDRYLKVGLVDDSDGTVLKERYCGGMFFFKYVRPNGYEIKSQKKYYNEANINSVCFTSIKLSNIEGNLVPKILGSYDRVNGSSFEQRENPLIYSAEEWNAIMNQ